MDQKVAKIWATNFPSACLLDFKDNVLGSDLKEIFGLWTEIAARGLTPEEAGTHGHTVDNPYLPLARVVAKAMTPTIAEKLWLVDVVAQRGLKEMSLERIQKLHDYLTSPPGKAFCSGLIRKATEQSLLTADFLPPII
ncbi:MAG: hypothetical protein EOO38_32350 [Cytophagaceae bacterium]|nr:MAG: hypothetical protein EOO38_32350 [Cytophagaceae bacterium]